MTDTTDTTDTTDGAEAGDAAHQPTNTAGEAPPRPPLGRLGRRAADVSTTGYGVNPDETEPDRSSWVPGAALLAALAFLGWANPWMLVVILGVVVMIFLHELGHYLTAKRAGMKVTEFFLGFGPKIWSTRRGETEYGVKAIPAGAYVKIIGMSNLDEVPPSDESRTYRQKTFGQRFSVAVAGSTMHFLLALLLIFVALTAIGQPAGTLDPAKQAREWRIDRVSPGTGAEQAGLRKGDRIVSVDGTRVETFEDLRPATKPHKGETVPLVYERDGRRVTTQVTLKPFYNWYVDRIVPGSGVARSGLGVGDQVVSIDGQATVGSKDLDGLLGDLKGKTVPVVYEDAKQRRHTEQVELTSLLLVGNTGFVGVGAGAAPNERVGVLRGVVRAPAEFVNIGSLSLKGLGHFFTPSGISSFAHQVTNARTDATASKDTARTTGTASDSKLLERGAPVGPESNRLMSILGVVRFGSDIGKVDPGALITLFALINISIGAINLAPLLPFDGGHVVIAFYEKAQELRLRRRRYFTDVARLLPFTYVVVVLLAMLFVSSIYLDLANPISAG